LDPEQKAKENQGEIPHWMLDAGCWIVDTGFRSGVSGCGGAEEK